MTPSPGGVGLILFGASFVVVGLARGVAPFVLIGAIFVALGAAATARKNRQRQAPRKAD